MKSRNQRWFDWYRSSKSDRRFPIWIAFLKNCTSVSGFYSSINIHLFEKRSTCWEAGETPGTECKYPEPWDLYQQARGKIYLLLNRCNADKVIHAGCLSHNSEPSGADKRGQEGTCPGVCAAGMRLAGGPRCAEGCWGFPDPRGQSWLQEWWCGTPEPGIFKQKCWN